jgi:hypothetical protein
MSVQPATWTSRDGSGTQDGGEQWHRVSPGLRQPADVGRRASAPFVAGRALGQGSTIAHVEHVDDSPAEQAPRDSSMASLYDMAEEAGIERSTAWRWLNAGELGEAKKYQGDRRIYVERALFLQALKAPRRRRRQRRREA